MKLPQYLKKATALSGAAAASAAMTWSAGVPPAAADHVYDTYGSRGYVWFARYHDFAVAYVTSDNCNAREDAAYQRVKDSTTGFFSARWPSGIRFSKYSCDGVVDINVDIRLDYDPNFATTHGTFGGENHSTLASSSFCATFGAPYPCGSHPSTVHLNKPKFDGASTAYRERLIMHETGHSLGLAHHCASDAIMNQGTAACNNGRWTQVMAYQATDRDGVRNVYPNWRYP